MHSDHAGQQRPSTRFQGCRISLHLSRRLVALVAAAAALVTPSAARAQTLSLGAANGYDLLAAYDPSTQAAGSFYSFQTSTIYSNVGLGQNGNLGGAFNIGSKLYADPSATISATGAIPTPISSNLSAPSAAAVSLEQAASSWNSGNSAVLSVAHTGNSYTVNGTSSGSAQNLVNLAANTAIGSASGQYTFTINGTSNQQFLINLGPNVSFTDVTVVLTGGVTRANIFYNNVGGMSTFGGSTIAGNILNMKGGSTFLSDDVVHGSVISDGAVYLNNTVVAPEMPTVFAAGFAGLCLLGHAGFRLLRGRSRRQARAVKCSPV
jgi:hypothetical protein